MRSANNTLCILFTLPTLFCVANYCVIKEAVCKLDNECIIHISTFDTQRFIYTFSELYTTSTMFFFFARLTVIAIKDFIMKINGFV